MKILHTADWHLGKKLERFERLPEQLQVLEEICAIAENENVDVVLLAGDLFDTFNPPVEAVEVFYKTLKRLSADGMRPVIAIAGNHDSPDRIEAPDPLARECGILFAGFPKSKIPVFELKNGFRVLRSEEGFIELKLPACETPLRLLLTPYANEFRLKQDMGTENSEEVLREVLSRHWSVLADRHCDQAGVNMLMAHLFFMKEGGEKQAEGEDEKHILVGGSQPVFSNNIPAKIQYVALGHLHRCHVIDTEPCPVLYSGSPLSYSFAESDQQKFVVIVEAEAGNEVNIRKVPLHSGKQLKQKRFESVSEALIWLEQNPDCIVDLTIATDEFLSATDRRMLLKSHDGIIGPTPELRAGLPGKNINKIDLSLGMEELFTQFFKTEKGQEPGKDILELFREVLGEGNNTK